MQARYIRPGLLHALIVVELTILAKRPISSEVRSIGSALPLGFSVRMLPNILVLEGTRLHVHERAPEWERIWCSGKLLRMGHLPGPDLWAACGQQRSQAAQPNSNANSGDNEKNMKNIMIEKQAPMDQLP